MRSIPIKVIAWPKQVGEQGDGCLDAVVALENRGAGDQRSVPPRIAVLTRVHVAVQQRVFVQRKLRKRVCVCGVRTGHHQPIGRVRGTGSQKVERHAGVRE